MNAGFPMEIVNSAVDQNIVVKRVKPIKRQRREIFTAL